MCVCMCLFERKTLTGSETKINRDTEGGERERERIMETERERDRDGQREKVSALHMYSVIQLCVTY